MSRVRIAAALACPGVDCSWIWSSGCARLAPLVVSRSRKSIDPLAETMLKFVQHRGFAVRFDPEDPATGDEQGGEQDQEAVPARPVDDCREHRAESPLMSAAVGQ
jgi:hypothetical protein